MDQRECVKGVSKEDEQVTVCPLLCFLVPIKGGGGGKEKKHVGRMNDLIPSMTSAQLLH